MAEDITFDMEFTPSYGVPVNVADGVQRLTVNNPSPFTFHGTNTYIVGGSSVAVIDPGPENEAHFEALMAALKGREVTHIFVSHTHRDHSPLAQRLSEETGAITVAEGPHRASRPLHAGRSIPSPKAPTPISCPISRSPTARSSRVTDGRCRPCIRPVIRPTIQPSGSREPACCFPPIT